MEELNAKPVGRGTFRLNTQDASLCAKCQGKQEHWLLHGRELEESSSLCPDCAFAVREAVANNALHAKTRYLADAVASARGSSVVRASKRELRPGVRIGAVIGIVACLLLLTLAALSSWLPHLWFFAAEVLIAAEIILFVSLNYIISQSDTQWRSSWMMVSCGFLVAAILGGWSAPTVLITVLSAAWLLAVVTIVERVALLLRQKKRSELERVKLKQMEQPPNVPQQREEEEAEHEDPWQLGVPGRGWSARKPAFEFRPGEYEPGAMVLGGPKQAPPSAEELHVESLLSSISIVSPGDEEGGASTVVLANVSQKVRELWRSAPRMTLGSIAMALSCRIVWYDRVWSGRVYAVFLLLAAAAIQVESVHRFKAALSALLASLACGALLPWRAIVSVVWGHVEVVAVAAVAVILFSLRNNKA